MAAAQQVKTAPSPDASRNPAPAETSAGTGLRAIGAEYLLAQAPAVSPNLELARTWRQIGKLETSVELIDQIVEKRGTAEDKTNWAKFKQQLQSTIEDITKRTAGGEQVNAQVLEPYFLALSGWRFGSSQAAGAPGASALPQGAAGASVPSQPAAPGVLPFLQPSGVPGSPLPPLTIKHGGPAEFWALERLEELWRDPSKISKFTDMLQHLRPPPKLRNRPAPAAPQKEAPQGAEPDPEDMNKLRDELFGPMNRLKTPTEPGQAPKTGGR